ncbi:hypothetical protein HYH03_008443 [Edaphochlamys debaryana]|uniref:Bifunctional inhibitor/plant lipid transfer protein/seed storage helical domain-containing protein n=1 Tax=Edaphochlamys debaryana TaxID=47281 RepID=A0A835XZU4_9CHLO|nr:hypothetical protein HYH03_008443 [Edaphochlamys debaryana]|eukprot:KAG2493308.1 hypothetical protein HYH03_008443 [Edaphochlamys debaryana]
MDRRFAALALVALLVCTALPAHAQDAKCVAAEKDLPNNPDIAAFKACAGTKPITTECCRKLLPFAQLYDCLKDPKYKAAADQFLAGATTVDEAQTQCLS